MKVLKEILFIQEGKEEYMEEFLIMTTECESRKI